MPSCCLLPCSSAKLPFCFPLLPLLCLSPPGILHSSFYFLRAESPLDPLKVGNCPPQSLVLQVHHAVCDGYHVGKFVETLQSTGDTE